MLLKRGMESPDVLNLELVLQGLNLFGEIEPNGIFDEKTENVVKYIQKAHNLVADGIVGTKTLDLLDRLYQPLVANFAPKETPVVTKQTDGTYPTGLEELASVEPHLSAKVLMIIDFAKQEGYNLTTVQGLRTFAQQDKLYAQRPRVTKARGGQSYHNYGVAVDLAFIVDGKISWNDKLYRNVGRWASRAGLEWGGNWHFVDYPHVQLANMPAIGKLLPVYTMAGGGENGIKAVWNKFVH